MFRFGVWLAFGNVAERGHEEHMEGREGSLWGVLAAEGRVELEEDVRRV